MSRVTHTGLTRGPVTLGGGSSSLPFSDDFARADGALAGDWTGATWSIASEKAVNTPTLGADLFDAGKGTFDSGVNDWVAVGSNTIENDAGALKVTFVDNGAGAYCVFRATNVLSTNLTVGRWYRCQLDVWVNAGSCRVAIAPTAGTSAFVTATSPTTITLDFLCTTTTGHGITFVNLSAGEIVWVDNITLKAIDAASLIATLPATSETVGVVKAAVTNTDLVAPAGVLGWLDNIVNPQNYILANYLGTPTGQAQLWKVVNGVPTRLLNTTVTRVAGGVVEVRRTATNTFQLWYAGSQVGADQTISDATVISNTLFGMLSTDGGNSLDSFFSGAPISEARVVGLGGSITAGSTASQIGTNNWMALIKNRMARDMTRYNVMSHVNSGIGGTPSWYGLVRLQTDVLQYSPNVVFVDFASNDISVDASGNRENGWAPAAEALIRRLRTELPNAMLIVNIFTWPDDYSYLSAIQEQVRDKWIELANRYDCLLLIWGSWLETLMPVPYVDTDVNVYLAGANDLHPNDTGHATIADMIMTNVGSNLDLNQWTKSLGDYPAYFADVGDFEYEPIIRDGTDNDGETGTGWTSDGITRLSSTVDDTIQWTGTFCSFGFDTTGSTGVMAYNIDGGGEFLMNTATKSPPFGGYQCFARGEHTVTARVVSGTVKIRKFQAI